LFFIPRRKFPVFVKKSVQDFIFMHIFAPEGKQDRKPLKSRSHEKQDEAYSNRRGAGRRCTPCLLREQAGCHGLDVVVDLLDGTAASLRLPSHGDQVLARLDQREVLRDGVDVREHGIDQRVLRADDQLQRIAPALGLDGNRAKIESLQRSAAQLRKANLRIDGLEKMIADMNRQLAEKKAEVEQLRESLVRMGDEVKSLTEEVAVRSAEVENLSGEKVELQNQLNTVYYIVGAEKELRDAQIINKQGFIGRTLTVGRNSNFDSFTMADSRLLSEVPVGQKKATLVTSHPEGSYELVTDANKVVEKLIITDPVRFWESSKILIISCK